MGDWHPRDNVHGTTDPDVEVEVREGCFAVAPDGTRSPLYRVKDTGNVDGPFAVWLDHSCDEWVVSDGLDAARVAREAREFAEAILARCDALDEVVRLAAEEQSMAERRSRDAVTGEFVTEEYAAAHPDTTVTETVDDEGPLDPEEGPLDDGPVPDAGDGEPPHKRP